MAQQPSSHERRMTPARAAASAASAVATSFAALLCGCSQVLVTPLGSTSEGRRQFAITCNQRASDSGTCHEKAMVACGGDYETLAIENTCPKTIVYDGQLATTASRRLLLIACEPSRRRAEPDGVSFVSTRKVATWSL
jgi:hypothetical protein